MIQSVDMDDSDESTASAATDHYGSMPLLAALWNGFSLARRLNLSLRFTVCPTLSVHVLQFASAASSLTDAPPLSLFSPLTQAMELSKVSSGSHTALFRGAFCGVDDVAVLVLGSVDDGAEGVSLMMFPLLSLSLLLLRFAPRLPLAPAVFLFIINSALPCSQRVPARIL